MPYEKIYSILSELILIFIVQIILKSKRSIIIHSNKSILVGVIYRHPRGSYADFQEKLTKKKYTNLTSLKLNLYW